MKMELKDCDEFLRKHDRYLILTHKRPDGDTIGSAAALCHALRRLGKTAQLFPNCEITETYLPFAEPYMAPEGYAADTFVSVDVADVGMLAKGYEGHIDLKIDHHIPRGEMGEFTLVRTECAACGEIVLELIERMLGSPDREEANLLYVALSTDTGCFCHANTNAAAFRAAARLMDAGADLPHLNKLLFCTKSRARLALEGLIYSSLRSFHDGQINAAIVTLDMLRESGVTENDCDDLANLPGQVSGNRVAVMIRENSADPPRCKISLRTDGGVDASALCARFGGGGHSRASGCELNMKPEDACTTIVKALEEVWA